MRSLRADEVAVGQRVLYAGHADFLGIADPELLQRGHILLPHHPGVVQKFYGPGVNHCIVQFVGLENEPISFAVGFDHREDGAYPGLLVPTREEWQQALSFGWWTSAPGPGRQ